MKTIIKVKVNFKLTRGGFDSDIYTFESDWHYKMWYNKQIADESYRKIIGLTKM